MNYTELTGMGSSGYHGYMPDGTPSESTPQEISPAPVVDALTRDLLTRQENGTETNVEPSSVGNSANADKQSFAREKASKQKKLVRENLIEVAQTVGNKSSVAAVLMDAQFVRTAAKMLKHNILQDVKTHDVNEPLLEELKKAKIEESLDELEQFIVNYGPDGQTVEEQSTKTRQNAILANASTISEFAKRLADYYEKTKLSKEYNDPFKQIVSFEELMTNFNITLADDRFGPGGEFSLLDIHEYVDEFGREMSTETAHPENFLRYLLERADFYHKFDPMAKIDLFQGMYIVAGTRKISLYEMLVDFPAYFRSRQSTLGELKVLESDPYRAEQQGEFHFYTDAERESDPNKARMLGYYENITTIDPDTKEEIVVKKAHVGNPEEDQERHTRVLPVFYEKKVDGEIVEVPVISWIANKEQWHTVEREDFSKAQDEALTQVWLMMNNHNYDADYRLKGMPSEKPLKDVLAEINNDNKWTRSTDRLLRIFNMPATTYREETVKTIEENGKVTYQAGPRTNEAQQKFSGEFKGQGTLGKACQRALAAYYHIAEANAAFEGYKGLEELNPFFEMLKGKDVNGAEIYYKQIISRILLSDKKFGYVHHGYDVKKAPGNCLIEVEFFNMLNDQGVPRTDPRMQGTFRKRHDWEKATFVDFMTLSKEDFLKEMQLRHFTPKMFDEVYAKLKERYKNDKTKQDELEALQKRLKLSSLQRKEAFAQWFIDEKKMDEKELLAAPIDKETGKPKDKDGIFYRFLHPEEGGEMNGLDFLAVGLFVKAFPSEFSNDLNPYINIRYQLNARDLMRQALKDTLSFTEKLDAFDANWAEEWAFTFTYHMGISARNDMLGIGHDAWSKMINTLFYRLRQTGGGNYPGNLDNLYGINRLGADPFQGLKVQVEGSGAYDKTLYEMLTGLEVEYEKDANGKDKKDEETGARTPVSVRFNINKDMPVFEFPGNAQRQFFADHVGHAIDLFIDITQNHEFGIDNLVSEDNLGRLTINHKAMQKLIDETWKHCRYGFDNNGFLYDNVLNGWWQDESFKANGQVSRTNHFGFKTLRELMFSPEVIEMGMYNRPDVSSWYVTKEGSGEAGKMARNVFAYLIKAQIAEHTKVNGEATLYSADQISVLVDAFMRYASRVMEGKPGEAIVLSGFFNPEETYKILASAHAILWMLYSKEYGEDAIGGFIAGFVQMLQIIMKEAGAGITLGK